MYINNGEENELKFVQYLNGKRISMLKPMFRELIDELFPLEKEEYLIKCWKNHLKQKVDIFIKINNNIKGISIKKGSRNSVHVERISDFIHFLIQNGIKKEIVIEYLKYHYADGSTNGKGLNRLSVEEYKSINQNKIDEINKAFNYEKIIKAAIDRFILKGKNSNYYIDAIIYGEIDDFIWITRKDIIDIIFSKKDVYSTAVHFGPIICQPKNRCLNHNPLYEKDRFCVQLKWYSLFDNIIENMNNKILNNIKKVVIE